MVAAIATVIAVTSPIFRLLSVVSFVTLTILPETAAFRLMLSTADALLIVLIVDVRLVYWGAPTSPIWVTPKPGT